MKYTKEQISEWKKEHGDLFEISVDGKSCILRSPRRKDLSYVSVVKDPIKLSETLMRQLWVEGDAEMIDDDKYFLPAVSQIQEVLKIKEAKIKKL